MKILYLSNSIIPSRSANSIHVIKMCQAFADNGHEIILLAPKFRNDIYEKNVSDIYEYYGVKRNFKIKKLWHPSIKGGIFFYSLNIFLYLFLNKGFNLIYGRFLYGCYLATFFKHEVIFEAHNYISNKNNFSHFIFKRLIKSKYFKRHIVISEALKKIYLENGYLNNFIIKVAHDGADDIPDFKSKINLHGNKDNLRIGYLGHLYKGRGVENIIHCAKQLKDNTFHIVGGLEEDIKYWKNIAKNFDLENIYFYGFVHPRETIKYLNSFDIVLAPYYKKVTVAGNIGDNSKIMSPLKIFEYMSRKKPIIASDLPILREILNDKNSLLVHYNDIKMWVDAIKKLDNAKLRSAIGDQAYIDFKNYTWKNRAKLVLR